MSASRPGQDETEVRSSKRRTCPQRVEKRQVSHAIDRQRAIEIASIHEEREGASDTLVRQPAILAPRASVHVGAREFRKGDHERSVPDVQVRGMQRLDRAGPARGRRGGLRGVTPSKTG